MINNKLRRFFSIFLSILMVFSNISTKTFALETDSDIGSNSQGVLQEEKKSSDGKPEVTDREVAIFKLGFGAAVVLGVVSALVYVPVNQISSSVQCSIAMRQRKSQFEKDFTNGKASEYTPRKQGEYWDWAACVEGLLKLSGVTLSQKDIVKKMFGGCEFFISNRTEDIGTRQFHSIGMRRAWQKMLSEVAPGLHFSQTFAYLDDEPDNNDIKNYILNYYNIIGHQAFAINDSYCYGGEAYAHFVNVIQIDDKRMTIEDPETGLQRTESIENFCSRYKKTDGTTIFPVLEMFTLTNRLDVPTFLSKPAE